MLLTGGPSLRAVGELGRTADPGRRRAPHGRRPGAARRVRRGSDADGLRYRRAGLYWRLEEGGLLFGWSDPDERAGRGARDRLGGVRAVPGSTGSVRARHAAASGCARSGQRRSTTPRTTCRSWARRSRPDGQRSKGVTIASAAGHGMMWGPGVARVAADLAVHGATSLIDVADLGLDRFDAHGRSRLAPDPIALPFPVADRLTAAGRSAAAAAVAATATAFARTGSAAFDRLRQIDRRHVASVQAAGFERADDRPVQPIGDVGASPGSSTSTNPTASRPRGTRRTTGRPRCSRRSCRVRPALVGASAVVSDHVADADATTGPQHAGDLSEDGRLVRRQVDDAVADDDVDRRRRERDRFDPALAELDVRGARLGGVAAGQLEHLVGHVEAVREAGRARRARRTAARRCRRPTRGPGRSRPARSSATAVGFPQPRLASTAASGSAARSVAS